MQPISKGVGNCCVFFQEWSYLTEWGVKIVVNFRAGT